MTLSQPTQSNPLSVELILKLALLQIVIIALANYTVQFTNTFLGYHYSYGMFVFPAAILATDLTIRLSGQANARIIVAIAFVPAILISAWLADWRIGLASGFAYLFGQLLDILVFQHIRERSLAWWPAPLLSTFVANVIDTYTFYFMAFYRSGDPFMAANWIEVATVDLCFKVVVCVVLFLPFYGILLHRLQARVLA